MRTLSGATADVPVVSRKRKRIAETQEIQIRTAHRRRKALTRSGVLVGFVLAMVVYPIVGTIGPYTDAASALPGIVKGQAPTTALALLGGGPALLSSDLPLPTIDEEARAIATSSEIIGGTPLPDCDPTTVVQGSNGRLSAKSLCRLWDGFLLNPEAAIAFTALNEHFKSVFGRSMCLDQTYRTLAQQYSTKASRGYYAATPGTSMHGWGLAVDFCASDTVGAAGAWIKKNAATYGWVHPAWASTVKYEPWHWEYARLTAKYYDNTWTGGNYSDGGTSTSTTSTTTTTKTTPTTVTSSTPAPQPSVATSPAPKVSVAPSPKP